MNDVDTLASALYGTTDGILKDAFRPGAVEPWRPPVGITPRLSDVELLILATMQALLGYTSEVSRIRLLRWPQPLLLGPAPTPGVHLSGPARRLRPDRGEGRRS
ncbi:hypothetical protein [Streptomyces sp. NPDC004266]|uniref:hypothetical protein n=1 Tax=Streptomyces sp. NPDC004266 TaxID=3364693 RepID=UPI00369F619B